MNRSENYNLTLQRVTTKDVKIVPTTTLSGVYINSKNEGMPLPKKRRNSLPCTEKNPGKGHAMT